MGIAYWVIEATRDGVAVEEHVPVLVQGPRKVMGEDGQERDVIDDLVKELQNRTPYGWYADIVPRPLTRDQLVELFVA